MSIPWPVEEQLANTEGRLNYLWKTRVLADCEFLVGKASKVVKCHKAVVYFASHVLHEKIQETEQDKLVVINDMEPEIFQHMLKYIYTDSPGITSASVAIKLAKAAKSYGLWQLEKDCYDYITVDLTPKNVLQRYQLAIKECDHKVMEKCTEIIRNQPTKVLNDESFLDASIDVVHDIFSLNQLEIDSEIELLKAADRYFNHNKTENNTANIRSLLEAIRFCTLTPEQFVEGTAGTTVLAADDAWAILANITPNISGVPMPEGFSTIKVRRTMDYPTVTTSLVENNNEFRKTFNLKFNEVIEGDGASTPEFAVGGFRWSVRMYSSTASGQDFIDCLVACDAIKDIWMCHAEVIVSLKRLEQFGPSYDRPRKYVFSKERPKLWLDQFITRKRVMDAPNGILQNGDLAVEVTVRILEDDAANNRKPLEKTCFGKLTPQFGEGTSGTTMFSADDTRRILANMRLAERLSTITRRRMPMVKKNEFIGDFSFKLIKVTKGDGVITPEFGTGECKWSVKMSLYTESGNGRDYLECLVSCRAFHVIWKCNAEVTVSLQRPGPSWERSRTYVFTRERPKLWFDRFIELERVLDATNGFLQYGDLVIEVNIRIQGYNYHVRKCDLVVTSM